MTQTNNEHLDITQLEQINAVQSIREAETLDDALRVMNGLAANGWFRLWDNATHPDGTSWRDKSPISQNEQQEVVAYTDGEGDFITKEMYDEYLKLGFYTECIVPLYTSPKQIPDGWKPIETVHKDGTQVIIKCSGGRVATAFYDDKPFVGEGWHVVVPFLGGFGSGTDTFIYFPEDMPTHWMPLPTPTNTEVGE